MTTEREALRHALQSQDAARARCARLRDDLGHATKLQRDCEKDLRVAEQARDTAEHRQAAAVAQGLGSGRTAFAPDTIAERAEQDYIAASYKLRVAHRARDHVAANLEAAENNLRAMQTAASEAADATIVSEVLDAYTPARLDGLIAELVEYVGAVIGCSALFPETLKPPAIRDLVSRLHRLGLPAIADQFHPLPGGKAEPRHGPYRRRYEAWREKLLADPATDLAEIPLPDILLIQPPRVPPVDPLKERLAALLPEGDQSVVGGELLSIAKGGGHVASM